MSYYDHAGIVRRFIREHGQQADPEIRRAAHRALDSLVNQCITEDDRLVLGRVKGRRARLGITPRYKVSLYSAHTHITIETDSLEAADTLISDWLKHQTNLGASWTTVERDDDAFPLEDASP